MHTSPMASALQGIIQMLSGIHSAQKKAYTIMVPRKSCLQEGSSWAPSGYCPRRLRVTACQTR